MSFCLTKSIKLKSTFLKFCLSYSLHRFQSNKLNVSKELFKNIIRKYQNLDFNSSSFFFFKFKQNKTKHKLN